MVLESGGRVSEVRLRCQLMRSKASPLEDDPRAPSLNIAVIVDHRYRPPLAVFRTAY
ncbi:MAG: hypothetical protein OJF52_004448 [Nitrospira sp.]|nr:MAG: hypothetical protein OJF52_004448 [Nitrospira sp.]